MYLFCVSRTAGLWLPPQVCEGQNCKGMERLVLKLTRKSSALSTRCNFACMRLCSVWNLLSPRSLYVMIEERLMHGDRTTLVNAWPDSPMTFVYAQRTTCKITTWPPTAADLSLTPGCGEAKAVAAICILCAIPAGMGKAPELRELLSDCQTRHIIILE